jgi:hypothetical protein
MKYIRNRNQFNGTSKIFEEANEQIYDGTWEDTFVGRFFSFLGRKVKHKIKKGGLNKLLKNLEKELEKITFIDQIENENENVQYYQVYQNIVRLKSYIRNVNPFSLDEFKDNLEEYIEFHEEKYNSDLPSKVINAHKEVKDGMEEILSFVNSLDNVSESLILEYLTDEGKKLNILPVGEIISEFWRKPIQRGDDVTLSIIKLTGNQKGYEKYKSDIKETLSNLRKELNNNIKYIKNDKIKELSTKLLNLLSSVSYDDYSTFGNVFEKEIKPLIEKILNIHDKYHKRKGIEDDIKEDDNKTLLRWYSKRKDQEVDGYTKQSGIKNILNDNGEILLNKWKELVASSEENPKEYSIKPFDGGVINFSTFDNTVRRGDLLQIGRVKVNGIEEGSGSESGLESPLAKKIKEKIDEVFSNDKVYREKMQISDSKLKEIHKTLKSKKEDQKNVVDPITILRIFNRSYNSFSITKEEYDDLSNRYSPKVASRKKSRYEVVGDTARDKKLFREWNDGVLSILQQYGDLLNNPTKKFIISMLDSNKMFGGAGSQAKLLSDHFDVPLDDAKKKVKSSIKESPGRHRIRMTEDKTIKFTSVKNVEINTDAIRRIPFILDVVLQSEGERGKQEKITCYPLSANKGKDVSSIKVKFTLGDDYGFIKNYMQGIPVEFDTGSLEDLGMSGDDDTPVYVGKILSDNEFIEKGSNTYKLSEIERLKDGKGLKDKIFDVKEIYMILGGKDEGLYRLPSLNKEMKKAIEDSPNDKLI